MIFFDVKFYYKTANDTVVLYTIRLRLSIAEPLFLKTAMSRFASILGIMLASGVTSPDSFKNLSDTIGNAAFARKFEG